MLRNKDEPWRFECRGGAGGHVCSTWGCDLFHLLDGQLNPTQEDFWLELAQIQAESIGWILLDEGAYLHVGSHEPVIQVVGIAKAEMAGGNVLWLT